MNLMKTYQVIDSVTFDNLIEKEFGKPYKCMLFHEEAYQDSIVHVDVEEDIYGMSFDDRTTPTVDEWLYFPNERRQRWQSQPAEGVLVEELRKRGYEFPDEFYIHVWW